MVQKEGKRSESGVDPGDSLEKHLLLLAWLLGCGRVEGDKSGKREEVTDHRGLERQGKEGWGIENEDEGRGCRFPMSVQFSCNLEIRLKPSIKRIFRKSNIAITSSSLVSCALRDRIKYLTCVVAEKPENEPDCQVPVRKEGEPHCLERWRREGMCPFWTSYLFGWYKRCTHLSSHQLTSLPSSACCSFTFPVLSKSRAQTDETVFRAVTASAWELPDLQHTGWAGVGTPGISFLLDPGLKISFVFSYYKILKN